MGGPTYRSYGTHLNNSGNIVGTSAEYYQSGNLTGYESGQAAWFYNGSTTQRIGLWDSNHTSQGYYAGERYTSVAFFNDANYAAGNSKQYGGVNAPTGQSAWRFNGSTTERIGYTSGLHTRSDGLQYSEVRFMNNAGQVAGQSRRFDPTYDFSYECGEYSCNVGQATAGQSAWLKTNSGTVQLGLNTAGHLDKSGNNSSYVTGLNNNGMAIGTSSRFQSGSTSYYGDLGSSAWIYNGSSTKRIGYTDTEHTATWNPGQQHQFSIAKFINDNGTVAGTSNRYLANGNDNGKTAWLYNNSGAGSYKKVGLTTGNHVSVNGYKDSNITVLNNNNQAAGTSTQFSGTNPSPSWNAHGTSAWFFNGSTNQKIGLYDSVHTDSLGHQENSVVDLNDNGIVVGQASITRGQYQTTYGSSAWLFNGTSTIEIGLTDAIYKACSGLCNDAKVTHLNNSNLVAGLNKLNGDTAFGQTAWLYDANTAETFAINLSSQANGTNFSEIKYLGDDGFALGIYNSYTNGFSGQRIFGFTKNTGAFDIGLLTDNLSLEGWTSLGGQLTANLSGQILGSYGNLNGKSSAYLLTPSSVPLPASAWLMASGLVGLAGLAKRRKNLH